jgi:hypothetical protein
MSTARIDLSVPVNAATLNGWLRLVPGFSPESLGRISSYFAGISGGPFSGRAVVSTGTANATATVTFSSTGPADAETMILLNITITAKTTVTDPLTQFTRSDTPSVDATNLAALINTSVNWNTRLSATANSGVVTITTKSPGADGNGLQISEAMANTTATAFTGGSDGTSVTVYNGY